MYVCPSSTHNTYMLIFWICTACGGASVIRIPDVEPDDDEEMEQDDVEPDDDDDEDDAFYFDRGDHLAKLAARTKDMDGGT